MTLHATAISVGQVELVKLTLTTVILVSQVIGSAHVLTSPVVDVLIATLPIPVVV